MSSSKTILFKTLSPQISHKYCFIFTSFLVYNFIIYYIYYIYIKLIIIIIIIIKEKLQWKPKPILLLPVDLNTIAPILYVMQSIEKLGDRMEKEFEKQGVKLINIVFIDEETYVYITEEIKEKSS